MVDIKQIKKFTGRLLLQSALYAKYSDDTNEAETRILLLNAIVMINDLSRGLTEVQMDNKNMKHYLATKRGGE